MVSADMLQLRLIKTLNLGYGFKWHNQIKSQ